MRPLGLVLAGGRSARMGRDKALLRFDGRPLAARAAEALRPLCDGVVFAASAANAEALRALAAGRVAVDARPGLGPLAGLRAGLALARRRVLVVACDEPRPRRDVARALLARAGGHPAAAGAPRGGELLPLPLVCAPRCLELADRLLAAGARSLLALTRQAARVVPLPPDAWAADADTPEELAALERRR